MLLNAGLASFSIQNQEWQFLHSRHALSELYFLKDILAYLDDNFEHGTSPLLIHFI